MHTEIPWARSSSKAMGSSLPVGTTRIVAGASSGRGAQGVQLTRHQPRPPHEELNWTHVRQSGHSHHQLSSSRVLLCGLSRWMPDSLPVAELRRGSIGFPSTNVLDNRAEGSPVTSRVAERKEGLGS
jgi:hypothetical protein